MSQFRYLILNTRLQFAQAQADSVCFPVAWYHLIVTLGALILSSTLALAQRVPFQVGNDNFTSEGLVKGMQASPAHCSQVTHAVWARTEHHGEECIRYWMAGLEGSAKPSNVLVYIPGDQLVFDSPDADYAKRSPTSMQLIAEGIYARVKVPVVLLSRPGIFGSSGEHKLRREAGESRLMSAALDQIKARHAVANYSLVGLSGGGHIVAALLAWRDDILCAVPTSSVSSPKLRWRLMGRTTDLTGSTKSYEPVDMLQSSSHFHPQLRVFVLGDPMDTSVPWSTQTPLANRLKEMGVATTLITGVGSDPQRHMLGASGQMVGSLCLCGVSTDEILKIASVGLKG